MKLLNEFRDFINKGNVVDLAVGVVIGAAFGNIITSLVNDIISPFVGLLIGETNFAAWKITLKQATTDSAGMAVEAVSLHVGKFLEAFVDFILVAFVIFMVVKAFIKMKKKEEEKPSAIPAPTAQEQLLTEIRDLLKK